MNSFILVDDFQARQANRLRRAGGHDITGGRRPSAESSEIRGATEDAEDNSSQAPRPGPFLAENGRRW